MFHVNGTHGLVYIESKNFSDGQPHIKIPHVREVPNNVTITGRITSADDLLKLQLIVDVLRYNGKKNISLQLSYLMGGRMDREINHTQPSTLRVICNTINSLKFEDIWLYDPHSVVSQTLLRAEVYEPYSTVSDIIQFKYKQFGIAPIIIIPDAGATGRVTRLIEGLNLETIQCVKTRNSSTQELSNFKVLGGDNLHNKNCLILDDICDGGRTFSSIANILKTEYAVRSVDLFVTHGIFSYGTKIEKIDAIYTTNSYKDMVLYDSNVIVYACPFAPIPEPTNLQNLKDNFK